MDFQQFLYAQICFLQVSHDMFHPHRIHIIQKCHPHIFFKKPGKIIRIQRNQPCDLLQGDVFRIVFFYIRSDHSQPLHIFFRYFHLVRSDGYAEVFHQQSQ